MTAPTHKIDWDVTLPLGGKPVLFAEMSIECSVEEGGSGPFVHTDKIHMHTGRNRKTGKFENAVTLPVPHHSEIKKQIGKALEENNLRRCFDVLFSYLVAQELAEDEALVEEMF